MKNNIRQKLVHFSVLFFVCCLLFFYNYSRVARVGKLNIFPQTTDELIRVRADWKKQMINIGAADFYGLLKENYKESDVQHSAAHVFGELLYELEGLRSVYVCDDSFFYGCYHSFMSRAVAENGLSVLVEINNYCLDKFDGLETGCQHGLGHAILQYRGSDNLHLALDDCSSFVIGAGSCLTGVFMEYNLPVIEGTGGVDVDVRPVNNDYYYPCFAIKDVYREECVFELPRWWMMLFNSDSNKAGGLCSSLSDKYRPICYEALGEQLILTDIPKIREGCLSLSDYQSVSHCLIGASWGVFSWPSRRVESLMVCDGLGDKEKQKCPTITEVELGRKNR